MELKGILKDQRDELEEIDKKRIVEREAQLYFKNLTSSNLIKITTGVRRAGKSVFTYNTLKNKIFGYVNFDDERLIEAKPDKILSSLLEIYGKNMRVIFFDEIQNLEKWELFVNRLKRAGYNLFITGSNSKLLSRELATHLTGRHISIEIYPFSFREYLRAINFKEDTETTRGKALIKHELENYILSSGFPEIVVERENPKIYLRELYRKIVERDIILRYNIAYKKTLREISLTLLSNPGRMASYNRIKKDFALGSEHTAKNYLSYLEEAYIILTLSKFSYKPKEVERSEKKIYVIDSGMANYVGIRQSIDTGFLMENTVAVELKRKQSFNPNIEVFYFKDYQQREVDFIIKEGTNVKQLIQVTYTTARNEIEQREIKALIKASNLLKCKNLLCITWDYEVEEEIKGKKIKFVPLWKWLLKNGLKQTHSLNNPFDF